MVAFARVLDSGGFSQAALAAVQRDDSFRAAIVGRGERFQLRFYDAKIARDGELAQVELAGKGCTC